MATPCAQPSWMQGTPSPLPTRRCPSSPPGSQKPLLAAPHPDAGPHLSPWWWPVLSPSQQFSVGCVGTGNSLPPAPRPQNGCFSPGIRGGSFTETKLMPGLRTAPLPFLSRDFEVDACLARKAVLTRTPLQHSPARPHPALGPCPSPGSLGLQALLGCPCSPVWRAAVAQDPHS